MYQEGWLGTPTYKNTNQFVNQAARATSANFPNITFFEETLLKRHYWRNFYLYPLQPFVG